MGKWDEYVVEEKPAASKWDSYAVPSGTPEITLDQKEAEKNLVDIPKENNLDKTLPFLQQRAAETFKDPMFQNPRAREAYYDQITKGYHGDDMFKVKAAIMNVDPYLKQQASEDVLGSLNPLGETVPTAAQAAASGIEHGVEKIVNTVEVGKKEGVGSAALNAGVGVGETLLGVASAVVPELAAFNIASGGLQQTAPETSAALAPATTALEKSYKDTGIPIPKWKENTAAVADFVANLVFFGGFHKGKQMLTPKEVIEKSTPENIKKANAAVESDYAPHPNEKIIDAIQKDIDENPNASYRPLLENRLAELHDEVAKDKDVKAKQNTEKNLLIEDKVKLETESENLSEESKKAIEPALKEIDKRLGKLLPEQTTPKMSETVEAPAQPTEVTEEQPLNTKENAVQKSSAGEVGAHPVGDESVRGKEESSGMGQGEQGQEVAAPRREVILAEAEPVSSKASNVFEDIEQAEQKANSSKSKKVRTRNENKLNKMKEELSPLHKFVEDNYERIAKELKSKKLLEAPCL